MRVIIARLMRHAFMAGYEAALNNATQEMEGSQSWPHYDPPEKDWQKLNSELTALGQY